MAIDLKFKQDSNGDWDIDFANGDFELTDGLDSAVYMSVFCEKRASSSQVSEPNLRRGHFTNEFSKIEGYQVGSLFWLYSQQAKNTDSNLRLLEGAVSDGLAWMIEDNIFSKVKVKATRSISTIQLEIELINKLQKNSRYYNLFAAT
jgi:phage gp46-like protein